jgi:hypothetical protein
MKAVFRTLVVALSKPFQRRAKRVRGVSAAAGLFKSVAVSPRDSTRQNFGPVVQM